MSDLAKRAVIYVDVDDTLVRHASSKPIPITRVIDQVRRLHARGFSLYCWSTGGAEYARRIATELGVAECFTEFLPKPTILIDDQEISAWLLKSFRPLEVDDAALDAVLP
jgi:predicted HAD superfamily phosphohydrolase YqeG